MTSWQSMLVGAMEAYLINGVGKLVIHLGGKENKTLPYSIYQSQFQVD